MEAFEAGKELDKLLVEKGQRSNIIKEAVFQAKQHGVPVQHVPTVKLDGLAGKKHQGVAAFLSAISFASLDRVIYDAFQSGKEPRIVVLDGVTDVRNLGAIARSADSAGFNALLIPAHGSARLNEFAVTASAGALHHLPVCRSMQLHQDLKHLKNSGVSLIAVDEYAEQYYFDVDLSGPIAVLLGDEGKGISKDLVTLADKHVKIPQLGKVSSLNVSVAAGTVMFEVIRQNADLLNL